MSAATTRVVDSLGDVPVAGQTTLRQAIAAAADGDTIEFAAGLFSASASRRLTLVGGALVLEKTLTIVGPGDRMDVREPKLLLEGGGADRILRVRAPGNIVVAGLGLTGGVAEGGGAVLIEPGATALFQVCDFTGNEAGGGGHGGAIHNQGTLTLDQCLVKGNRAPAGNGGGIAAIGRVTVLRSLLEGNMASGLGGGVFAESAELVIESSTAAANVAGAGGAVAVVASGRAVATATLTAVTVADNLADAQAGGLYVEGGGAVANVGGSIFARNLIVNKSGTRTPHDLATQKSGKINSADYNIVVKPGTTLSPYAPNDQIGVDPLLGDLNYVGGRTRVFPIGLSSPACDRGNPNYAGLLTTDQRGFARVWPAGGRVDVGAFEYSVVLSSGGNLVVECTGAMTPARPTASLVLPRGGTIAVTWSIGGVAQPTSTMTVPDDGLPYELAWSGLFPYGTTLVTVAVTSGAVDLSCSSTVSVVDTTPPQITVQGANPYYVELGAGFTDPGATATDVRDGTVAVTATSTVDAGKLGVYLVSYAAVDAAGNQATASRTVQVRDTTRPVIVTQPSNLTVEATSPAGAVVTFAAPTATDASGSISVATSPVSGATFPLGQTVVTITATDGSGNSTTSSFTVTVVDTTPPTIAPYGNRVVEAASGAGAIVTFVPAPSATDLVSVPTVTAAPASGSTFPLGDTTVTITATDAAGNTAQGNFTVTVRDTTKPTLILPASLTVNASSPLGAVVTFAPAATDAVSTPTVTSSPASGSNFKVGTTVVTVTATDTAGNTATGTFQVTVLDPFGITLTNVIWPSAIALNLGPATPGGLRTATFQQALARAGESRWYKFTGPPGSRIEITLTNLPANFDLVVYGDIRQAYNQLLGLTGSSSTAAQQMLALLGAEFAPEAYAPEAYSPEAYAPEAYAPEAYAPEAYSPEAYSPEAYAPEAYAPEAYAPEAYAPEAYAPEAYAPEAYAPEAYAPEAYASAQQRSLVSFSAAPGTVSEGLRFHTYSRSGEFYIRVRGQNGVFSLQSPFNLTVALQQDQCANLADTNTTPASVPSIAGTPTSLLLWNRARTSGSEADRAALASALALFAAAANGVVVDLGTDARIQALNAQADANPYCPTAKNLVAETIRNLIQSCRQVAPTIADITLIGNDDVIPFFRSDDRAMLASEANYFPPVQNATQSQTSLRYAQVLSQDRYGASCQVVLGTGPYDLPELPVGRIVETAAEVKAYLDTYATLFNGTAGTGGVLPTPRTGFVSGYDFLADSAQAIQAEFAAGLGAGGAVDSLISPIDQPPAFGWTADQLRAALLGARHDLNYLAGHFSTARALAADYTTRLLAQEVALAPVDLAFALFLSAGCHSGYNTVDPHAVPFLTEQPDWAQAFARKRAIWIAGTGYQYGDTDFIEYTERLLLDVARALRSGSGPVPIGRALVEAKRRYLAQTALMRGIHEKTLLQVALYGLPMVKVNLPGTRLSASNPAGDVSAVTPISTGPGAVLNLKRGELAISPVLTRVDRILDVVGSTATVTASYFRGSDGVVALAGEPVRPLESLNVSRPEGLVRGIGFRSGQYQDLPGIRPFTGAAATETRGVHGRFSTDVLYPIRPWNLNQMGELCAADGISALNVFPAQFRSDAADSALGTMRTYQQMQFTVFYSPLRTSTALANPPAINVVASTVSAAGVSFSIDVAASLGVGVQEVWVTYTGLAGSPFHGSWSSLTLTAPAAASGIGLWTGTLPLSSPGDAGQIRFLVQAVNGVGGVAQSTNFGRYFTPGSSTLDGLGVTGAATSVAFVGTVPATGFYRTELPLQARLTDGAGQPLAGRRILFQLGSVSRSSLTNSIGVAATTLLLGAPPAEYSLEASFAGDATHQRGSERRTFTIQKMPTQLAFDASVFVPDSANVVVNLKANDGTPLKERTVVFLVEQGTTKTALAEITDGAGQARLPRAAMLPGSYLITATFARPVTLPDGSVIPLSDPLYEGSTASRTVVVSTALEFGSEQAWVNYTDATAPGATATNLGVSKAEVQGELTGPSPSFGPNTIMSSTKASRVQAYVFARLSGRVIADGFASLKVQANDNLHWRGDALLNGTRVELNVDWDGAGGSGKYHVWIYPASGSGPLYHAEPALLTFELILGTGDNETPAGGISEIGGPAKPWTQQTGGSRVRSN